MTLYSRFPYATRSTRNGRQMLLVYVGGRKHLRPWNDAREWAATLRRARLRVVSGGRR